jgi:isopenicillin N synthase-like dioxygenase
MGLPSIDLALLESAAGGGELQRLRSAARDLGAFLIGGHGVGAQVTAGLLDLSGKFFALPQAERNAIDMIHSPYFRGYSAVGSERTLGQPDMREQLDVGPEEVPVVLAPGGPAYLRLHGPNLWPASLPELRESVLAWMQLLRGISTRVMAAIVEAVGLPHGALADGFSGQPHERLKIIKYPAAGAASTQQGVGEHSDSGFLTLIVQDGSRGLQVHDGQQFVDVIAQRSELIAILGRALDEATSGEAVAARHRVTSPADGGERISVSYFLNPRLDHADYGFEALKVVLRSHPPTAQRYFADLLAQNEPS